MAARIFLVEDHAMVRHGLGQLIGMDKDLAVCGEAENGAQALEGIRTLQPDVAVIDVSLPGKNGIELVKELRAQSISVPALIISMHEEARYTKIALEAGAQGYLMKEAIAENLLLAIRRLLEGEIYLSERMASFHAVRSTGRQ